VRSVTFVSWFSAHVAALSKAAFGWLRAHIAWSSTRAARIASWIWPRIASLIESSFVSTITKWIVAPISVLGLVGLLASYVVLGDFQPQILGLKPPSLPDGSLSAQMFMTKLRSDFNALSQIDPASESTRRFAEVREISVFPSINLTADLEERIARSIGRRSYTISPNVTGTPASYKVIVDIITPAGGHKFVQFVSAQKHLDGVASEIARAVMKELSPKAVVMDRLQARQYSAARITLNLMPQDDSFTVKYLCVVDLLQQGLTHTDSCQQAKKRATTPQDADSLEGWIALMQGKPKDAVSIYTKEIESTDRSGDAQVTAYFERAMAYAEQKRFRQAVDDMAKVVELRPGNATTVCYQALFQENAGLLNAASANFRASISLDWRVLDAYKHLAKLAGSTEEKAEAKKSLATALKTLTQAPQAQPQVCSIWDATGL